MYIVRTARMYQKRMFEFWFFLILFYSLSCEMAVGLCPGSLELSILQILLIIVLKFGSFRRMGTDKVSILVVRVILNRPMNDESPITMCIVTDNAFKRALEIYLIHWMCWNVFIIDYLIIP